jgi:hypothetical protein
VLDLAAHPESSEIEALDGAERSCGCASSPASASRTRRACWA